MALLSYDEEETESMAEGFKRLRRARGKQRQVPFFWVEQAADKQPRLLIGKKNKKKLKTSETLPLRRTAKKKKLIAEGMAWKNDEMGVTFSVFKGEMRPKKARILLKQMQKLCGVRLGRILVEAMDVDEASAVGHEYIKELDAENEESRQSAQAIQTDQQAIRTALLGYPDAGLSPELAKLFSEEDLAKAARITDPALMDRFLATKVSELISSIAELPFKTRNMYKSGAYIKGVEKTLRKTQKSGKPETDAEAWELVVQIHEEFREEVEEASAKLAPLKESYEAASRFLHETSQKLQTEHDATQDLFNSEPDEAQVVERSREVAAILPAVDPAGSRFIEVALVLVDAYSEVLTLLDEEKTYYGLRKQEYAALKPPYVAEFEAASKPAQDWLDEWTQAADSDHLASATGRDLATTALEADEAAHTQRTDQVTQIREWIAKLQWGDKADTFVAKQAALDEALEAQRQLRDSHRDPVAAASDKLRDTNKLLRKRNQEKKYLERELDKLKFTLWRGHKYKKKRAELVDKIKGLTREIAGLQSQAMSGEASIEDGARLQVEKKADEVARFERDLREKELALKNTSRLRRDKRKSLSREIDALKGQIQGVGLEQAQQEAREQNQDPEWRMKQVSEALARKQEERRALLRDLHDLKNKVKRFKTQASRNKEMIALSKKMAGLDKEILGLEGEKLEWRKELIAYREQSHAAEDAVMKARNELAWETAKLQGERRERAQEALDVALSEAGLDKEALEGAVDKRQETAKQLEARQLHLYEASQEAQRLQQQIEELENPAREGVDAAREGADRKRAELDKARALFEAVGNEDPAGIFASWMREDPAPTVRELLPDGWLDLEDADLDSEQLRARNELIGWGIDLRVTELEEAQLHRLHAVMRLILKANVGRAEEQSAQANAALDLASTRAEYENLQNSTRAAQEKEAEIREKLTTVTQMLGSDREQLATLEVSFRELEEKVNTKSLDDPRNPGKKVAAQAALESARKHVAEVEPGTPAHEQATNTYAQLRKIVLPTLESYEAAKKRFEDLKQIIENKEKLEKKLAVGGVIKKGKLPKYSERARKAETAEKTFYLEHQDDLDAPDWKALQSERDKRLQALQSQLKAAEKKRDEGREAYEAALAADKKTLAELQGMQQKLSEIIKGDEGAKQALLDLHLAQRDEEDAKAELRVTAAHMAGQANRDLLIQLQKRAAGLCKKATATFKLFKNVEDIFEGSKNGQLQGLAADHPEQYAVAMTYKDEILDLVSQIEAAGGRIEDYKEFLDPIPKSLWPDRFVEESRDFGELEALFQNEDERSEQARAKAAGQASAVLQLLTGFRAENLTGEMSKGRRAGKILHDAEDFLIANGATFGKTLCAIDLGFWADGQVANSPTGGAWQACSAIGVALSAINLGKDAKAIFYDDSKEYREGDVDGGALEMRQMREALERTTAEKVFSLGEDMTDLVYKTSFMLDCFASAGSIGRASTTSMSVVPGLGIAATALLLAYKLQAAGAAQKKLNQDAEMETDSLIDEETCRDYAMQQALSGFAQKSREERNKAVIDTIGAAAALTAQIAVTCSPAAAATPGAAVVGWISEAAAGVVNIGYGKYCDYKRVRKAKKLLKEARQGSRRAMTKLFKFNKTYATQLMLMRAAEGQAIAVRYCESRGLSRGEILDDKTSNAVLRKFLLDADGCKEAKTVSASVRGDWDSLVNTQKFLDQNEAGAYGRAPQAPRWFNIQDVLIKNTLESPDLEAGLKAQSLERLLTGWRTSLQTFQKLEADLVTHRRWQPGTFTDAMKADLENTQKVSSTLVDKYIPELEARITALEGQPDQLDAWPDRLAA